MNKEKKQNDPKKDLIVAIVISIVLPLIVVILSKGALPLYGAMILSAVCIAFFYFNYLRETKSDKKAQEKVSAVMDNSLFEGSEWREKFLNYKSEHRFIRASKDGMRADLVKRYRAAFSPGILIFGIFMAVGSIGLLLSDMHYTILLPVGGLLLGLLIIWAELTISFAIPVRKFFERNDIDLKAVETSYNGGKILLHNDKRSGINVGSTYTVIIGGTVVQAIENSSIRSLSHNVKRIKEYTDGIYRGDKFEHSLCISADSEYIVQLDEFQVEMVIEELSRYAPDAVKTNAPREESPV